MRLLQFICLVATIFQVNGYKNYHASPYSGNCGLQLSKGQSGVYHAYTGNNHGLYSSGNSGASSNHHGAASTHHSKVASSSNGNDNNNDAHNAGYYGSYGSYGSGSGRYPYINSASQSGNGYNSNNNYQGSSSSSYDTTASNSASDSKYGTGGSYGNGASDAGYNTESYGSGSLAGSGSSLYQKNGNSNNGNSYGSGSLAGSGSSLSHTNGNSNYGGDSYDTNSQSAGSSSNSGSSSSLSSSQGNYASGSGWSQTQGTGNEDSDDITSSSRFSRDVLAAHNSYRARHSTPPVTLDKTMSRKAQEWANEIASGRSSYGHSPEAVEGVYGESIQALNFNTHSGASLMEGWYEEMDNYNYKYPLIVRKPRNKRNSHFTAMLWYATRKIGVGKATAPDGKSYVVISYYPPGNNVDVLEDNVFPPKN